MRSTRFGGLPYVSVALSHRSQSITLTRVLVDTGWGGTAFAADRRIATLSGFRCDRCHQIYTWDLGVVDTVCGADTTS